MNSLTYVFAGIKAAGLIVAWFDKANADGKITLTEMTTLVTKLADCFGLPISISTPASIIEPMKTAGEVVGVVKLITDK